MPFTFTPGEGGGWVVGTAEPTVPPFGQFTYTIQPIGGWELEDMTQPATFFAGFASVGPQGPQGEPGQDGDSATITVGTTTTGAAGSDATVVNVGTASAAVLNFTIPQGIQGIQGIKGDTGDSGVAYATSPLAYDALTKTVSIDLSAYYLASNPAGYITSAALSGYATQSWVTSQGYITSAALAPYETTAHAASTYATISSLGSAAYQPTTYWIQSPTVAATDGQIPAWDAATAKPVWIDNAARTLFITAKNQSGSTIPARSVVYISGATGANPLISLAQANAEATSATTIGITSAAIANGATGQVVTAGLLSKVDTSAWTEGQGLYLSATTAGGFATTLPVAPNHGVYLGVVTRSHANQGAIEVTIKNYQELEEMSDVLIATPANGDLLVYETASSLWKNKTLADAGIQATLPSSSTSTAGKVQLATDAQAIAGTSTTLAVTPSNVFWNRATPGMGMLAGASTVGLTSGTGAATNASMFGFTVVGPDSGFVGYGTRRFQINNGQIGSINQQFGIINFDERIVLAFRLSPYLVSSGTPNADSVINVNYGTVLGADNGGNLARKGFGIQIYGHNNPMRLTVHDGTTYRTIDSSFTPVSTTTGVAFDIVLVSQAGTVSLYQRTTRSGGWTQIATSNNGPTGLSAVNAGSVDFSCRSESTAVTSVRWRMLGGFTTIEY